MFEMSPSWPDTRSTPDLKKELHHRDDRERKPGPHNMGYKRLSRLILAVSARDPAISARILAS